MTSKPNGGAKKGRYPDKLHPRQLKAAYLIAEGLTLSESAEQLNMSRQTLSDWRNHHPLFRAKLEELEAERDEQIRHALSATHVFMLSQLRKLMQEGSHENRLKTIEYYNNTFPRSDSENSAPSPLLAGNSLFNELSLRTRSRRTEN